VRILLYCPDNGVTRNFMPQLWMFLLQSLTPPRHEARLIDGNTQPMTRAIAKAYGVAGAIRAAGVRVPYKISHLVARIFFRGIYFPPKGAWGWLKVIAQNRGSIFRMVKDSFTRWNPAPTRDADGMAMPQISGAACDPCVRRQFRSILAKKRRRSSWTNPSVSPNSLASCRWVPNPPSKL
jgi:hypothetical protein